MANARNTFKSMLSVLQNIIDHDNYQLAVNQVALFSKIITAFDE